VLSDWYVVVRGGSADVAHVVDVLDTSPEHAIEQDEKAGEWRLRSERLAGIPDHAAAWAIAQDILTQLTDVAAAVANDRVRLSPGALGRTKPDGTSDIWVHPEPIMLRLRTFPPTILISGQVVGEAPASKMLRLQEEKPHLRLALHFLNGEESWFDLYKAYEAIRDGSGGKDRLIAHGADPEEIDRFTETANNYAAVGDAARHARLGVQPPENPMTIGRAEDFVRSLLSQWLASLGDSTSGPPQ
jgi:hypothetical protein